MHRFLASIFVFGTSSALAAVPALLRDVNQYAATPGVQLPVIRAGNHLFLRTFQSEIGGELASIDTTTGAVAVFDVERGPRGSNPTELAQLGNQLVFAATTTAHGTEVWVSDGTLTGTVELRDLNPGAASSFPHGFASDGAGNVYFSANDGTHGDELWITTGTPGNATLVELQPGPQGSSPTNVTPVPGGLVFAVRGEPWAATTFATGLIKDIRPGAAPSSPSDFTYVPAPLNQVVFAANATGTNRELWITNTTAVGTTQVAEIEATGGSNPTDLRLVNGLVILRATTSANGVELWRTDGTATGTAIIADTYPGMHAGVSDLFSGATLGTTQYVFPAIFPDSGIEPAVTDGTTITRLADVLPGPGNSWISFDEGTASTVVSTPTKTYLGLDDGVHGWELWQTDGTPAGTSLAVDLLPGLGSSQARPIAVDGETVFFLAYDDTRFGVWRYAGGSATLLTDLSLPETAGAGIAYAATVGDRVFFNAVDRDAGYELWSTDGTPAGTQRVVDQVPGFGSLFPFQLVAAGGRLFMGGRTPASGNELFTWDPATNAVTLVKDIVPGDGGSGASGFTSFGARVLFIASTPAFGDELWISDGTAAGTAMVKDINPDAGGSQVRQIVVAGSRAYFQATGPTGSAIFVTDGTEAATIELQRNDSIGELLALNNGNLLVSLATIDEGSELWISDGTPSGTHLVTDLVSGPDSSDPTNLTLAGSRIFFTAQIPEAGRELWVLDPASGGITAVGDLTPGPDDTIFGNLVALGDGVVFTTKVGEGAALWFSDGTPTGTHTIDLCPGDRACNPKSVFSFAGAAFFLFNDGTHGQELWRTDGTTAGTALVADSVPGPGSFSYSPEGLAFLGGKVFFPGCDDTHGCEPWIFDYDQCGADTNKLTPGDCGCGVPDVDADLSGVSDCLLPDELRARIDALTALITPLTRPKNKTERAVLKMALQTIRAKLEALQAYYDANPTRFVALKNSLATTRKAVKKLTRAGRGITKPRVKALRALGALRQAVA